MRIGIVGAGQLGRMMAAAGLPMGLEFLFLDRATDSPAAAFGPVLAGELDDPDRLRELANASDVVTFDVENLPPAAAELLSGLRPFQPNVGALAQAQDRLHEKRLFRSLGIATAEFATVDGLDELSRAVERIGLPAVLKRRRLGYDGRGQRFLQRREDAEPAWHALEQAPMILEAMVPYDQEVSLIAARNVSGQIRFYPLTRNVHWEGVLDYSIAPVPNAALQAMAEDCVRRLLEHLDYAGVLTVEFFVVGDTLLANEYAPRVHNSGHWTIEGAVTSQFENHLRGILDWPLGDTRALGHAAMVNFLGTVPDPRQILAVESSHYHVYGKEPRPRRKVGHATVVSDNADTLKARLGFLRRVTGPRG